MNAGLIDIQRLADRMKSASTPTNVLIQEALKDPDVEFLTLPNGDTFEDAFVWPGFCQTQLGLDPDKLWAELTAVPTWSSNEPIPFRPKGDDAHYIAGDHPALRIRGWPLNRHKIWLQAGYSAGLYRYRYPGWQWPISYATHDIAHLQPVNRVAKGLNGILTHSGLHKHTHYIVTRYDHEHDSINFHADRDEDFVENNYFVVIKLGEPRPFEFRLRPTAADPKPRPFFSEALAAGTAIFVGVKSADGPAANDLIQHAVPAMKSPTGPSGSIVSRCIDTLIPWNRVHKEVQKRLGRATGKKSKVKDVCARRLK